MNRTDGNLAYQYQARQLSAAPQRTPSREEILRRIREEEAQRQAEIRAEKQRLAVQVRRQHTRLLVQLVAVILLVGAAFGFLLYRQANIVEANFAVTRLQRTINETNRANNQLKEQLARQTNLREIRLSAFKIFGLQEPSQSQIIKVNLPQVDRVEFAGSGQQTIAKNQLADLERYFQMQQDFQVLTYAP